MWPKNFGYTIMIWTNQIWKVAGYFHNAEIPCWSWNMPFSMKIPGDNFSCHRRTFYVWIANNIEVVLLWALLCSNTTYCYFLHRKKIFEMLFYTMILPKQNQIVEFFPTFLNQKNLQYYTCISLLLRNK